MILLVSYIFLALGVSFLCSILEATLLSLTPTYLASIEEKRPKVGLLWRNLKQDIDKPLAAILSLNTIAHTMGAAGAGAQATLLFGEVYFGIISAVLTLLILIFSEIIPKTLGARYWQQLAPSCAYILRWVQWAMYPLVLGSKSLTSLLVSDTEAKTLSREDFYILAKIGRKEGVINADEANAISSLLAFRGLLAKDVMTPRTVVASLPAHACVGDISKTDPSLKFSRIPIFADHGDDFIGFVRKDKIYRELAQERLDTKLVELKHDFISVLEGKSLPDLMKKMAEDRTPICLIVTEYGDPLGIATMEDLVETMLGIEIMDESDSHIDMQERARELWRLRAEANSLDPDATRKFQK